MKSTIASLLGSAALVAAHGFVDNGLIGGENYTFYQPYQDPYSSPAPERISRPIQGNGPVEDVTSIDIQCGGYTAGGIEGSTPAKLVAKAAAGEEVTLNWTLWPESHVGPTITYMAKCPSDDCTSWQPGTEAVWFKVQEEGREGTSNTWGATSLMKAGNSGVKYTIPECIAPGQYLVRHEIIALHAAYAYPGAQFYPGCHQLEVTGSGSTSPSDLVAFPGAYKPADAGITYDPYKASEYTIPGPALFSCSGSGSGSGSAPAPSAAPSAAPASTAAPAATSAPASSVVSAATPSQTAVAEDDEEEDCPAEAPSATVSAAATVPTLSAEEDDEYDCPAESEAPAATTTAAPVATPTQAADEEEDDCPAESEAPVATPVPTQTAEDEEDDCPAESEAPVATPTPTQAADEEEDDCPAETPSATAVAKRMALHERRLA
ncbi:Cellulose-growth-specific protein [Colletotrichum higginsianum IMI 349063]|uniref:lytic cellulose monooxygenase (C4-dehydrogenating) n=2 Tax=Colletotrichum higginsianum TaxID=80884 RepID=A0A1B7YS47_COLHI|nr:Cellulose-growth-specific protein [Colletotrichum higginsianum IMI 349063]OBR14774.1 Cellulose-growth-specific protein [Colletotrichum higginsianum IMI 349063]TID02379.1 Polysaccharide monooxygenase Cel61a [Colletotrichum higginsianum]